jgi:spore maturation protein SpmA
LINFRYLVLRKYILFLSHDRASRKCGLLSSIINILKPVIKYFFRKNAFLINFRYRVLRKYILFLSHDRVSRKCGLLSSLINILKPVIKYFFRKNAFLIILVTVFLGNKALSYLINISSLLASISSGKMLFWLILIDRVLWKSGLLSSLVNILKPVIKYFFRKSAF